MQSFTQHETVPHTRYKKGSVALGKIDQKTERDRDTSRNEYIAKSDEDNNKTKFVCTTIERRLRAAFKVFLFVYVIYTILQM